MLKEVLTEIYTRDLIKLLNEVTLYQDEKKGGLLKMALATVQEI